MKKDNKKFWNEIADTWSRSIDNNEDVLRNEFIVPQFLDFIGQVKEKQILDVGCGEGSYTAALGQRAKSVLGIDFSESMIEISRKNNQIENVSFEVEDMTKISKKHEGKFDIAIAPMSLMDCTNISEAFRSISRCVKDNGFVVVSVLHPCFNTNKSKWIYEGNTVVGRLVPDYFDSKQEMVPWKIKVNGEDVIAKSYNNPYQLHEYLNSASQSGLYLLETLEPQPSEELVLKFGGKHSKWKDCVPLVLFLKFRKVNL